MLSPPEELLQRDPIGLFAGCLGVAVQPGLQFGDEKVVCHCRSSTKTLIRVARLMLPNAKPLRPNSAIPSIAAS